MRLMAAVALAYGFVAAPLMTASIASGSPGYCDGPDCIPYLDRTAVEGDSCVQNTRWNLGLDAAGNTLACSSRSQWIAAPPLVGVRTLRLPCGEDKGLAMTPDGVTLSCTGGAWSADYSWTFYR
jgi:hypothetical protein